MGIKNLLKFLKEYPNLVRNAEIEDYSNKKVAIDISILLYQVVISIRNTGADLTNSKGEITSHILGLFNKTITLLKRNIIPIYVFDGCPPQLKNKVLSNRKNNRIKAHEKMVNASTEVERIKYFKRCVHITSEQIKQSQELLDLMGIPYIVSNEEADSQCAYLSKKGIVYGVYTEDMDILTFGAQKIIRNLTSYKKNIIEISLSDILNKLELSYEEFIDFCILLGCDYCNGINEIQPNILFKYFKEVKTIEDTLELLKKNGFRVPENIDYKKAKEYFLECKSNKYLDYKNINLRKPNIEDLEEKLVNKYSLIKNKIDKKILFLNSFYNKSKRKSINI
jgi:flap endonuclease-1